MSLPYFIPGLVFQFLYRIFIMEVSQRCIVKKNKNAFEYFLPGKIHRCKAIASRNKMELVIPDVQCLTGKLHRLLPAYHQAYSVRMQNASPSKCIGCGGIGVYHYPVSYIVLALQYIFRKVAYLHFLGCLGMIKLSEFFQSSNRLGISFPFCGCYFNNIR